MHSILLVFDENNLKFPLSIVCMDGLSAKKISEEGKGFGIEISHRD